ncbi:hypothetical protein [Pectobacterium brasiliense]|uniref:hypothetical protein n=1 Tax=Pectobacterium brasiliense TaxID=180957 RepID=UPI00193E2785|nr:hypothetical protein [Pectobacterium brasiliense]QRN34303.1 hypothetical protein IHJ54_20785 [Pectobacterium brasiliense]
MRVTATHLIQWSDKREAQGMLPILVRRLLSATSRITAITMPGGDSVNAPGWDGIVDVTQGNPWVPDGISYWELGTSKDPASKANSDFEKRLKQISADQTTQATFVFVTPRRWQGKNAWREQARSRSVWADVQVWDADDLEAWLETSSATSLWLGMQLGIAGHGIETVENYWEHWNNQSHPAITAPALFRGREKSKLTLQNSIEQHESLIAVMADSQSEAVAFVCALLIEEGHCSRAACVTSEQGWQFVDANPGIELVVITDNRLSKRRAPREGMSLLVPMAFGDQAFNLMGIGGQAIDQRMVELRRPRPDEFEQSLCELGIAATDATRYTRSLGRSWTVFRRWHAQNPVTKKPDWVEDADATSLLLLTLVGAWDSASEGDKACVEQIANRPYEDIENELLRLATLDDAPVVKIGSLWKAKAPMELLHLMAPRLTDTILARFFQVARAAFEQPDPVLELEEDKRWMASIYGKVREQSGVVLEAMAESIAKLGYFSDNFNHVAIGNSVRHFVTQLLEDADGERWLSVSSFLRSFAEAAPDEFLNAVQSSLRKPSKPVVRLITETQSSEISGRCWHANLLWALELLAWYPARLGRITSILAELSGVEVKGNWGNTPFNTLISLFRPWYPQTAASVELRLRAIRHVVDRHPDVAWNLLLALLPRPHDVASPNAKPHWRDDDAGTGDAITYADILQFVLPIADLLIEKAQNNARHIADLVPKINELDIRFRDKTIELVSSAKALPNEEREIVRNAVRKFLNWENSFNQDGDKHDRYSTDVLRPLFDTLAADDLVIRHSWIFANGWIELPDGREEDYEEADKARKALRASTLREIYQALSWPGIDRLAKHCGDPRLVGWELIEEPFERDDMARWLCQWYLDTSRGPSLYDSLTSGVLHALPQAELLDFLNICLPQLEQKSASSEKMAGFMVNAPQGINLWQLIENKYQTLIDHFWLNVQPPYFQSNKEHLLFCIEKLLAAGRPQTAMDAMGDRSGDLPSELLILILKGIAAGQEENAKFPRSWNISRVFKTLADAGYNPSEMVSLEFIYYPLLKRDEYGAPYLMAEILDNPDSFMELICLAYKPHNTARESLPEHLQTAARTASTLLHEAHGVPGMGQNGEINSELFFSWINRVRELAKEKDREAVTDLTIGAWLSDWPLNKNLEFWPDSIIADLLDQDDCEDIRRGFYTGVHNSRGATTRMPYDGGTQERQVAEKFRRFANNWKDSKPNLSVMIEKLAKSYEYEAKRQDEDGLWSQES